MKKPISPEKQCIMHIDMDAFFAAVEQNDNPLLRGRPVIIGEGARGVVSTASYEARTFGIHSAMPVWQAKKLCPQGVFLPSRMARYQEVSAQVMAELHNFSPCVEQASVDEAYLDGTGCAGLFGAPVEMAQKIQRAVFSATGLTCSVGAAPIKFLAKIASDMRKPHGIFVLSYADMLPFLASLPVRKIPGVGKKFVADLDVLGIKTCADVSRFPQDFWEKRFGKVGLVLFERAQGKDARPVQSEIAQKSESAENTFAEDTKDFAVLHAWLLQQSERVTQNLRRKNQQGRTVTLKVKFADFSSITRSKTLSEPTNCTRVLYESAVELLAAVPLKMGVRLIGVGLSNYAQDAVQHNFLCDMMPARASNPQSSPINILSEEEKRRSEKIDTVFDVVRQKFGKHALVRGQLFSPKKDK